MSISEYFFRKPPTCREFKEAKRVLPEEDRAVLENKIVSVRHYRRKFTEALTDRRKKKKAIPLNLIRGFLNSLGKDGEDLVLVLANMPATEESLQARLNNYLNLKEDELKRKLEALGGAGRIALLKSLEGMELDQYWFGDAFDASERFNFENDLLRDLPFRAERVRALDLGSGVGRASLNFLTAFEIRYGTKEKNRFAEERLYAVDVVERFQTATQNNLRVQGVLPEHVLRADFKALPDEFQHGDFHLAWLMMHTLCFDVTEEGLALTLKGVERALIKRGRVMLDSVGLYHMEDIPPKDVIRDMEDLMNIYSLFVKRHWMQIRAKLKTQGMPIPTRQVRFPFQDHPPGKDTVLVNREVLTPELIDHVIRKKRIRLRRWIDPKSNAPFFLSRFKVDLPQDRMKSLGMQWIAENNLRDFLMREICYRLEIQEAGNVVQVPLYSLPPEEQAAYKPRILGHARVNEMLERIAIAMVRGYVQHYYIYEKY